MLLYELLECLLDRLRRSIYCFCVRFVDVCIHTLSNHFEFLSKAVFLALTKATRSSCEVRPSFSFIEDFSHSQSLLLQFS
mgnify:CR=1 FL=1